MKKTNVDLKNQCNILLELLEREVALYRDLLNFSTRKQGALVVMDAKDLTKALCDVEIVVNEIKQSIKARSYILSELEEHLDLPSGTVSLKEVMDSGGEATAKRYRGVSNTLAPILERLVLVNSGNMTLVNNILDYLDFATQTLEYRNQGNIYMVKKGGRPDVFRISRS
ncbi:MAG: flagellar protein FlgN [Firmicutes bacterium]|jgi:hypothetical protein|nr:flagellar protein FlgN [Bacillota bacterium]